MEEVVPCTLLVEGVRFGPQFAMYLEAGKLSRDDLARGTQVGSAHGF